jgi:hypothetical protein
MLSLWMGALVLAASPQLHRLLHQDANNLGHHCLVSQVKQHLLLAGLVPAIVAEPAAVIVTLIPGFSFQLLPSAEYRFDPSRAPPISTPTAMVVGGAAS